MAAHKRLDQVGTGSGQRRHSRDRRPARARLQLREML